MNSNAVIWRIRICSYFVCLGLKVSQGERLCKMVRRGNTIAEGRAQYKAEEPFLKEGKGRRQLEEHLQHVECDWCGDYLEINLAVECRECAYIGHSNCFRDHLNPCDAGIVCPVTGQVPELPSKMMERQLAGGICGFMYNLVC